MLSCAYRGVWFLTVILFLPFSARTAPTSTTETDSIVRRKGYLKDTLAINIAADHRHDISLPPTMHDLTWRDWQTRTGELPPDFSLMASTPFLPDPLVLDENGTTEPVTTIEQWHQKRATIKSRFQKWVSGTVPPPPGNLKASIISDTIDPSGARLRMIELKFGPDQKAVMTVELMLPSGPGPFPVYMTQWNHRGWAQLAVRRGYIGCVYAGADSKDDTQAYQALYPDYDFTALMRRAWGASRVVDYLLTRPEVNNDQIAITGHSRNGKQALWAGAFDERINAVISSSSGTGGITPWRFSDPQYCNQTLDDICSNAAHWFHPRLRFFFGREDKLPVDQNELIALIAPRSLLFHYSMVEKQLNPWVNEQVFQSVKSVYELLGAEKKIGIYPRMGEHAVAARDLERCIDFLDIQFGRRDLKWKNELRYTFNFDQWYSANPDAVAEATSITPINLGSTLEANASGVSYEGVPTTGILSRLEWLLGNAPAGVAPIEREVGRPANIDWTYSITGLPNIKNTTVTSMVANATMGDHLPGTLYYPTTTTGSIRTKANGKLPVVVYLHQYSYAHGFVYGYRKGGSGTAQVFQQLADAGYAILAIDMFGFGTRIEEARDFYQRYPQWSKMGKMVSDVKACVDVLQSVDNIDTSRIYVMGNTIGGTVGLIAAAQDNRIAGIAVTAAMSPWRSSDSHYESIRTLSHLHALMPRLGLYANNPAQAPVDYTEILSAIAPRPVLVIAPTLDRHSNPVAVSSAMDVVQSVYDNYSEPDNLQFLTPREINRQTDTMTNEMINFYNKQGKRGGAATTTTTR